MMKIAVIFAMCIAFGHAEVQANKTTTFAKTDCTKYSDPGTVAQCAGSQYSAGQIGNTTFVGYLQKAISMIAPQTSFYGLGITTGIQKKLIIGKANDPVFEKAISVDYDPREWAYKPTGIELPGKFTKPVLIYAVNRNIDLPDWNNGVYQGWMPTGTDTTAMGYVAEGYGGFSTGQKCNCRDYTEWFADNLRRRPKGVAIVMNSNRWCPEAKEGTAELIVGELVKKVRDGVDGKQEYYAFSWAKWIEGEFGEVPVEFQQVFQ